MKYQVEFFEDAHGNSPIWNFLEYLRTKSITNKDAEAPSQGDSARQSRAGRISQPKGDFNMTTWTDYKEYVKSIDSPNKKEMEEIEELSSIISAIIKERNELGISQRELAELCGIPQSSVARIESP